MDKPLTLLTLFHLNDSLGSRFRIDCSKIPHSLQCHYGSSRVVFQSLCGSIDCHNQLMKCHRCCHYLTHLTKHSESISSPDTLFFFPHSFSPSFVGFLRYFGIIISIDLPNTFFAKLNRSFFLLTTVHLHFFCLGLTCMC